MLVLTRKKGQSLMIGHDVEISIIDIQGDQVRVGIKAPKSVAIHRKEVFDEIRQENIMATETQTSTDRLMNAAGELRQTISGKSTRNGENHT